MTAKGKIVSFEDSLLARDPGLVTEWDYTRNNLLNLFPDRISQFSNKKAWWICSRCGHSWQAKVNNRSNGRGCPKCAQELRNAKKRKAEKGINDLETLDPEIAKTWNYNRNTKYSPSDLKPHSEVKVWWVCEKGHEWESTISNRVRNRRCPICSSGLRTSLPEQAIFFYLSKLFVTQNRVNLAGWEVDVYLPEYNIGIEYDGWLYHSSKEAKSREKKKDLALKNSNIKLIRVKENKEYDKVTDEVVYYIIESNYLHLNFAINAILSLISKNIQKPLDVDVDFKRDRLEIINNFYTFTKNHSLEKEHPEIAKEWDYKKNMPLKPDMVSSGSGESVWWVCFKGHSYKAIVGNRVRMGSGCPYCSNHTLLRGFNDLETVYPDIAEEWNHEKNGALLPSEVLPRVSKKVWWVCPNKHEYQATVASRTGGTGCPYCARKALLPGYNDLATLFPNLVSEWNIEKNGTLSPDRITAYNSRKVWWTCPNGHAYEKSVISRTKEKRSCPYCSGRKVLRGFNDLATLNPELANEWDYSKNTLLPTDVTAGSGKRVWWVCSNCGAEYQTSICNRSGKKATGCPKCNNAWNGSGARHRALMINKRPALLSEWDFDKNTKLGIDPSLVFATDMTRVWWICRQCRYSWQSSIRNRVRGHDCPACGRKRSCKEKKNPTFEDSLAAHSRDLLSEWDYQKNNGIDPRTVYYGTRTKVGWVCKKCGYKWDASVSNRVNGKGCPACAHIVVLPGKNDLQTLYPELAKEFDVAKNGKAPSEVFPQSNIEYWWTCSEGHSYHAPPSQRTRLNRGCPYCSGRLAITGVNDLKTLRPDLAEEWDFEKNTVLPSDVKIGSGKKVWWICPSCGNEYEAIIGNRTAHGTGCPKCKKKREK